MRNEEGIGAGVERVLAVLLGVSCVNEEEEVVDITVAAVIVSGVSVSEV